MAQLNWEVPEKTVYVVTSVFRDEDVAFEFELAMIEEHGDEVVVSEKRQGGWNVHVCLDPQAVFPAGMGEDETVAGMALTAVARTQYRADLVFFGRVDVNKLPCFLNNGTTI